MNQLLRVTLAALTALTVSLGTATHAYAVPSPEEIERQIDAKWRVLEPIIERYNGLNSELKTNRAKAEALQKQLQPLQLSVDVAMSRVQAIAVQAYKGGRMSALNAILSASTSGGLVDQLGKLDALARNQRLQISDVTVARDKYANDKRALDELIAKQATQEAELAAQKADIEKQIDELQKLRQQAYGGSPPGAGDLKPAACPAEYAPGAPDTAARTACAQIGKMYRWGAEGPTNFDCSGLTMYAWKAGGRSLPHNSQAQYGATKRVSRGDLRAGDLVFFYSPISHVGIYVGNGYMVHASRAGEPIRMRLVDKQGGPITGYGRVG